METERGEGRKQAKKENRSERGTRSGEKEG